MIKKSRGGELIESGGKRRGVDQNTGSGEGVDKRLERQVVAGQGVEMSRYGDMMKEVAVTIRG